MGKEQLNISIDGGIKQLVMAKIGRGNIANYIESILETEVQFRDDVTIENKQNKINKLISINALLKNRLEELTSKYNKLNKEFKEYKSKQDDHNILIASG